MIEPRTIVAILVVLSVLKGSAAFAEEGVPLPLPPGAKEVMHFDEDWLQTNYIIEAKYPDTSVARFYLSNVKEPWSRCFDRIPDWMSFGDTSDGKDRFIHQIGMHWVNRKEGKLLLVAIVYYSAGSKYRREPDTSSQHVIVAEYPEQDLDQVMELLKLKCER